MSEIGLRNARAAAERIMDSSLPIYRAVQRGTPELIGSAVLLEIAGRRFLCTAAHVLDVRGGANLYLPHGTTLQVFGAPDVHITQLPSSGRRDDDKFDFAVVELTEANFDRFSASRFIRIEEIDVNDVPGDGRHYGFVGYPASRNKSKRGTNAVREHLVRFTGRPLPQDRYETEGFNPSAHLLVEFNEQQMLDEAGNTVRPINPKGLSGGAVWRLGDLDDFEAGRQVEKFVGIGMEYRADALIAVRISLILEAMRGMYPDLSEAIPQAQWVGAGVAVVQR